MFAKACLGLPTLTCFFSLLWLMYFQIFNIPLKHVKLLIVAPWLEPWCVSYRPRFDPGSQTLFKCLSKITFIKLLQLSLSFVPFVANTALLHTCWTLLWCPQKMNIFFHIWHPTPIITTLVNLEQISFHFYEYYINIINFWNAGMTEEDHVATLH